MPFQPGAFLRDLRDLSGCKLRAFFALYYTYVGVWLTLSTRLRLGTHVFDEEWDLLVVLDTCRVDALRAVADEYDFIDGVGAITSLGSTSVEWLSQTFDRDHADQIARTAYVTGKIDSETILRDADYPPNYRQPPATWPAWDVVSADDFALLDEVWRDATDDRLRVVPPQPLTERAIRAGREGDHDRLLVHYMQPHTPYIAELLSAGVTDETTVPAVDADPFSALRAGRVDRAEVWERYLDNLRFVLDSVGLLLENVDADRVVITADHGEGFGEYGVYEHPVGCPAPTVKRVPWAVTTATDTGSYPTESDVVDAESAEDAPDERRPERVAQDGGTPSDEAGGRRDDTQSA
jgi:hypothetical protein